MKRAGIRKHWFQVASNRDALLKGRKALASFGGGNTRRVTGTFPSPNGPTKLVRRRLIENLAGSFAHGPNHITSIGEVTAEIREPICVQIG